MIGHTHLPHGAPSRLLRLLRTPLFEQLVDGRLPSRPLVDIEVVDACVLDEPRRCARPGVVWRRADSGSEPTNDRVYFRFGCQEGHTDGPRPLLGHAQEATARREPRGSTRFLYRG
jgi:hypothetical protein